MKKHSQQIAYIRVSSAGQNTDRQVVLFDELEVDKTFTDKLSGGTKERPQLNAMLSHLREGDFVHVSSIDRLARNLAHLVGLVEEITGKGCSIKFHKEGLTFTGDNSPMQKLQLQMMGSFAEFEKSLINERAAEGRVLAKARGVKFGPTSKLVQQDKEIAKLYRQGKSVAALARQFDTSRPSIYKSFERTGTVPSKVG